MEELAHELIDAVLQWRLRKDGSCRRLKELADKLKRLGLG